MGKKKHKNKKKHDFEKLMQSYDSFSNYSNKHLDKKWMDIEYDLDQMIREIKKSDKKYEKMKAKVKKGKIKVDLKQYRRDHPVHTRKKALEFFKSGNVLEIIQELIVNGKSVVKVVASMICTLIVLILSCKKIREIIPINMLERMRSAYEYCSAV